MDNHSSDTPEKRRLYFELKTISDKGVPILIDGRRSSPGFVASRASACTRHFSYMRDYIFVGGVLKELRFDRVRNP